MQFLILLAIVVGVIARPDGGFYDSKYENINVDEIVSNTRLLNSYSLCFLGKGKCTPEGTDIKELIPEAVQSKCGKCSEKQKPLVAKFIKAILEKLPNEWEELSAKYNPKGEYTQELNEFIGQYAPN